MKRIDLTGRRFGRLVVTGRAGTYISPSGGRKKQWQCQCDCGNETIATTTNLNRNHTTSCGCHMREITATIGKANTTHGMSYEREYRSWQSMNNRCYNPEATGFDYYGGRGIRVCWRWQGSFENFLADMGPRPPGKTLDRIDNDGDYHPTNCRWATAKEQAANRR